MLKLKWMGPKTLTCPKHKRFGGDAGAVKAGCKFCTNIATVANGMRRFANFAAQTAGDIDKYKDLIKKRREATC